MIISENLLTMQESSLRKLRNSDENSLSTPYFREKT